uniref:Methyltransferase n=1 Tax=viral metagenome TaxID=1070528 RepID=A0A6C0BVR1_9ZZZZ
MSLINSFNRLLYLIHNKHNITFIHNMKSSYNNTVDFGDLIANTTFLKQPKTILEIGILEGFSLKKFADYAPDATIWGYDIFEDFNGNHAVKNDIVDKFAYNKNITIEHGDFFEIVKSLDDKSIDLLHIDIANNGDVYQFVFDNYMQKLSDGGTIILEGGSLERDNIEWMNKYNKPKIQPILEKYSNVYNIKTFGEIPSITIINL